MEPMSWLTTGGIVAAVVAGWSHVKTAFSYLSSFLIVTVNLSDYRLRVAAGMYLRLNHRTAPSGVFNIIARWRQLKGESITRAVPYRLLNSTNLFIRGWRIYLVTLQTGLLRITAIRGTIDPERFVCDALDFYERYNQDNKTNEVRQLNRYMVFQVMGDDKYAHNSTPQLARRSGESDEASPPSDNGLTDYLFPKLEDSFRYPSSMFTDDIQEDAFDCLYVPPQVTEYIRFAEEWMERRDWYIERRLPWRRGWMIYGPGGTGKSSLAKAIAKRLGIPIYQYYLSTLSDQEFIREWRNMTLPAIVLFEDFDTVFNGREPLTEHKSLTFDCVLNQISGVDSPDGVFLIVTTNRLDTIDPAMGVSTVHGAISSRPGRIDTVIYLGPMDEECRRRMAQRILCDWPELIDETVMLGEGMTGAQFQELCVQSAFTKMRQPTLLRAVNG